MLTVAACGATTEPATGTIEVTAHTTGRDLDPGGYTVSVDGIGATPLPPNGTATVTGLAPGAHTLTLTGVAANCVLQGSAMVPVSVPASGPARADVAVVCAFANTFAYFQGDVSLQGGGVYETGIEPGASPVRVATSISWPPSWSPDGSTLALVTQGSPSGIFRVDADGGNSRQLINDAAVYQVAEKRS